MEDIQNIVNLLGADCLDDTDKEFIEMLKKNINENYYDNEDKKTYKYTELQFNNDKIIRERRAFENQLVKMKKEALMQVIKQKYIRYYSNIIDASTPEELHKVLPELADLKKKEEELTDAKSGPVMFITISPALSVGVYELIKYIEKLTKFKFIKKSLYVLEQRFDGMPTENYKAQGDGLHAHLLINKGDYKFSHVKRDCARVFANTTVNLDYKFIRDRDIQKVQNYMVGEKADDSKKKKQEIDKIWRRAMGLKNFYGDLFEELDKPSA